jgi:hypothetical protein
LTANDLRAVAHRIVKRMTREHPDEAAVLATMVLSEILAVGLFHNDEAGVTAFADALNNRLAELALTHEARTSWQLVRAKRSHRH